MTKLDLIGHRGVRGIDTENTISAIKRAADINVDAIEFDVRCTKDGVLVACHNRNLKSIYGIDKFIDQVNYSEIKNLKAPNGEIIPTLQEIVNAKVDKPLLLDVKDKDSAERINEMMVRSNQPYLVTTFVRSEAKRFRELNKDLFISFGTFINPFSGLKFAKSINANAVTWNLLMLNPITYWLAKMANIQILLYQNYIAASIHPLNSKIYVKIIKTLYPGISICSDRPDNLIN